MEFLANSFKYEPGALEEIKCLGDTQRTDKTIDMLKREPRIGLRTYRKKKI